MTTNKTFSPARFILLLCFVVTGLMANAQPKKYVIIGYVGGYRGLLDTNMVHAKKLTHINYAFVDVQHNRAWLTNMRTDTTNFKNLNKLKKDNPDLKIMISIGGWAWSKHFSDMALTDTSRNAFAKSAADIVRKYNLDGVDIDWEYPNNRGDGNVYRPEDKQNYTLMFKAIRLALDTVSKETGKRMYMSAAVGGFAGFIKDTEMDKVASYLDYINLMTYDYYNNVIANHHTNLYASKKYKSNENADEAYRDFAAAGVPKNKLIMGLAFYGHAAKVSDTTDKRGLGKPVSGQARLGGSGYTFIRDSLTNRRGFVYYRDHKAKAPYLFNAKTRQFVSYDDEWSVKKKCQYVVKHDMGGVMFWEYAEDRKEYLLNEANKDLK